MPERLWDIPYTNFSQKDTGISREQKDVLTGLHLLQDTLGEFNTGLIKASQFMSAFSTQRREIQGSFLAMGNQMERATTLAQALHQRTETILTADNLHVEVTDQEASEQLPYERKFLISAIDPYVNLDKVTSALHIALFYSSTGEPQRLNCFLREFVASRTGSFSFHKQTDEHISLYQEAEGEDASVEAYIQMEMGRMPLSVSPALKRILESTSSNVQTHIHKAIKPVISEDIFLTVCYALDGLGTTLLSAGDKQKPEHQ